jgi:hypothetical protein
MLYANSQISSMIRLTLENSSSIPVDYIKLTFDDSTSREAQAIINEGELSPEQAYELDWDQMNRPSLVWEVQEHSQIHNNPAGAGQIQETSSGSGAAAGTRSGSGGMIGIAPGGRVVLSIRCLGKVGW